MVKKKVLACFMATTLIMGVSGCGQQSASTSVDVAKDSTTQQTSEDVSEVQTEEVAAIEKPDSITWWTHDGLNEEDYVKEWDAKFTEITGVTLEHTQVSNNEYSQLLEAAFASGTEPNVFDLSCDQKVAYYASQGAIADLTDLIKSSGIYDKVDKELWDSIAIDGKIYGIPKEQPGGVLNYVRQDWLDRLNMEAPTNYEEYLTMLRAFRDDIKECTTPLTAPGLNSSMNLPEFYWDAEPDFTYVNGKWVDGMLEDNFVGAMQRLQDAYAEGLIDTEVVTNTTSACRDKWYAGEVGVFSYWGGKWGNTLEGRLQENFPEASLTGLDAIDETYYRYAAMSIRCIDGRLTPEQVAQVFEYFFVPAHDGGDGQELFYCGVEGLHYNYNENGKMEYAEMVSAEGPFQSVWGSPWSATTPFDRADVLPQPAEKVTITSDTLAKSAQFKKTTPSSDTLNKITSDLTAIRQETIAKIVMGNLSVEEGIENYREQATALGIEQVLEEMNAQ